MLKSVFELSYFIRKMFVKEWFFQNVQIPLFLTGWLCRYHFRLALRHLSVPSKKFSFAALVNIRQNLLQFKH